LVITEALPLADAWVAAWLPGSEGQGVADVLFGDAPFSGTLPYAWPRSMEQVPLSALEADPEGPLRARGYGLTASEWAGALVMQRARYRKDTRPLSAEDRALLKLIANQSHVQSVARLRLALQTVWRMNQGQRSGSVRHVCPNPVSGSLLE
jgi:beta-glucosidase